MSKQLMFAAGLVTLLAACGAHTPPPAPAPAPGPAPVTAGSATCAPSGAPIFAIQRTDVQGGPEQTAVYATGAWTITLGSGAPQTGCLVAADLATIQRDVGAPWQTHPRGGIQCRMVHAPTTFTANGKVVYTDVGCASDVLDDASAKALAEIQAIVVSAATTTSGK